MNTEAIERLEVVATEMNAAADRIERSNRRFVKVIALIVAIQILLLIAANNSRSREHVLAPTNVRATAH